MKKKLYNQKVTADQRAALINLWLEGSISAVRKMERELGVVYKYTDKRAYELGLTKQRVRQGESDPRWAWATAGGKAAWEKANGKVSI